jgi:hypothetical protein
MHRPPITGKGAGIAELGLRPRLPLSETMGPAQACARGNDCVVPVGHYRTGPRARRRPAVRAKFPHAVIQPISVTSSQAASFLDVEQGDANPSEVVDSHRAATAGSTNARTLGQSRGARSTRVSVATWAF